MATMKNMPDGLKLALIGALLGKSDTTRITEAGFVDLDEGEGGDDQSAQLMVEAINGETGESFSNIVRKARGMPERRMATLEECAVLIEHAGPCRFQVGQRVKWNPALHYDGYDMPSVDDVAIVTQVFDKPMHNVGEMNSNQAAIRNDFAVAYTIQNPKTERWELHEFVYDSRRFIPAGE